MTTIEIPPSELPLRIDAGDKKYAIGRVFMDNNGIRGASLFTLINPSIRLDSYSSTQNIGQVQVVHPNLVDVEDAFIRIGHLEFDSLQFMHAYDNIYKYRGWLTKVKAYDLDTAKKMVAVVDEKGLTYEYFPPEVTLRGFELPFPVSVEIYYSTDEVLEELLATIET